MMRSFNKNKENRRIDIRKRFHFDPKTQQSKLRIVQPQKISEIIIRDENGQFSSVKEHQDFNDSSWLAKLVNGLQEQDGQSTNQLPSQNNLQSLSKQNSNIFNKLSSNVYTIQRKASQQIAKYTERKSVPAILSYKNKRRQKDGKKMSLQSISMTNQGVEKQKVSMTKQKKVFKQNDHKNSNKIKQKTIYNKQNQNRKKIKMTQNYQQKDNHKNSIINYSSIKQEEEEQIQMKKFDQSNNNENLHVIIDIQEMSLKTQMSKQETPQPKRLLFEDQNTKNRKHVKESKKYFTTINKNEKKQTKLKKVQKSNESQSVVGQNLKQKQQITESFPHKQMQKDIQSLNQKYISINQEENQEIFGYAENPNKKENQEIGSYANLLQCKKDLYNQNEQIISHNEFLDTFKHQPVKAELNIVPRIGIIKKNNTQKCGQTFKPFTVKQNLEKLSLKQIKNFEDKQIRIPTFSDRFPQQKLIKKQNVNQREQFNHQISLYSPLKNASTRMSQDRIRPSPSTIKKGADKTNKKLQQIRQRHLGAYQKQSPKFNNKKVTSFSEKQNYFSIESRILKFQQIFQKLNNHGQPTIHKFNCFDTSLNQEQKYQFGSIISKIKYLNQSYNLNQFVRECLKLIYTHAENEGKPLINTNIQYKPISSIPHPQAVDAARQIKRYLRDGESLHRGNSMSQIKSDQRNVSQTRVLTQKKLDTIDSESRYMKSDFAFQPLFPQTISTHAAYTEALSSSNMRQFDRMGFQAYNEKKTQSAKDKYESNDLGHIIDNLNSKLNSYIQSNNLEDTYKKFKLEFVQLRRNMHY